MCACAIKDKTARFVRHLRAASEDKMPGKHVKDRRIQKTQALLREALVSLIHEKPYDAIAVTEILERTNFGSSTFYPYLRYKDKLLGSCIHVMLRSVQSAALP